MDDLSGLTWTSDAPKKPTPQYLGSELRSSPPVSRGSTPFSQPSARPVSPVKSSTAGGDSFASLVSFGSGANEKNLSLAERQRRLAEQKAREEEERRTKLASQYGDGNSGDFWNRLEMAGSSRSGGSGLSGDNSKQAVPGDDEDDILAAFNASAPVDKSSHFPVPSSSASPAPDSTSRSGQRYASSSGNAPVLMDDDDDPFGLANLKPKPATQQSTNPQDLDDEDILGPLSKPVSEFQRQQQASPPQIVREETLSTTADETLDKRLAELVDMGFPIEDSRRALAETESGTDVQAAVGWLLQRAHEESRRKAEAKDMRRTRQVADMDPYRETSAGKEPGRTRESGNPAWMRSNDSGYPSRSRTSSRDRRPAADKDPAQLASEFGNNLFKSANSLWKTGTRRMQQVVQELNAPADPSQPRWMRHATETVTYEERKVESGRGANRGKAINSPSGDLMTDEAMMLDAPRPSQVKPPRSSSTPRHAPPDMAQHTSRSPVPFSGQQLPRTQIGRPSIPRDPSKTRLNRLNADEDAAQAYVSPSRRRRPAPNSTVPSEPQPDLLEQSGPPPKPKRPPTASPVNKPLPSRPSAPLQLRPKAVARNIPQIQPSALQTCIQQRQKGSDAFKRGDYSAAHTSYSNALSSVPETHPIAIILLANRALTGLKIGEPKSAIGDADRAIKIIGPAKGESETIDFGNGEPIKDMKEFFGKVLMRKAEALEQLERWAEAAKVWQEAVESGHGGSSSIQGRNRCEKAAGVRQLSSPSTPSPRPNGTPSKPARPPVKRPPVAPSAKPAEAVSRLRAANEAADRADNERFALADSVEARINAWKGGKQDNLRALLASLDNILWPETQWKKINMSELLLPNKVKIQYMKGIAKVHPDKVRSSGLIKCFTLLTRAFRYL